MNADPPNEQEIFGRAWECTSPEERAAYLDAACGVDTPLRRRIEALLEIHSAAGGFVSGRAEDDPTGDAGSTAEELNGKEVGTVISRYRLLQRIGEGGFGVVYMAEQREPVKRRVALKIIKLGMDTRQVVARFEAERQALAMMDHPNIAKVLDGGATENGRPYFVMELVKGMPITQYCDEHRLPIPDRLRLFAEVCAAIHHAHQKGIIHRDVKPSNVLVAVQEGRPVPKVIDFGVAKATQHELTDKTIFTRYQELIGTPAYMSPEQAQMTGLDIDTRSDIYSLGVLLYEMLTSHTPFETRQLLSAGFEEMRRRITQDEPAKPSTRLSALLPETRLEVAKYRRTDAHRLIGQLRGELDWIVLKAMEKDRNRRYESASALAHEVRSYLENRPITAAAPGWGYQLRKFAARHRPAVTMAGIILVMLLAGIISSTYFAARATRAEQRARQEAEIAEAASRFITDDLFTQADPEVEPDRELRVRTLIDRAAQQIQARFEGRPLVEANIHSTIGQIYYKLGEPSAAERHLNRAFELRFHELGEAHPSTIIAMSDLAMNHSVQRRNQDARDLAENAFRLARQTLGERDPQTLKQLSRLAVICFVSSDAAAAHRYASNAVVLFPRVSGIDPDDHSQALHVLGRLTGTQGKVAEGEELIREAHRLLARSLGSTDPRTAMAKNRIAAYLYDHRYKLDEAESLYLDALEQHRRVLGESHRRTLSIRGNLALLYSLPESPRPDRAALHQLEILQYGTGVQLSNALQRFRALLPKSSLVRLNVASAEDSAGRWSASPPLSTWADSSFDDASWQTGAPQRGGELWLRQTWTIERLPEEPPILVFRNSGDLEVFLNGRRIPRRLWRRAPNFQLVLGDPPLLANLRRGKNVLAVHGHEFDVREPLRFDAFERPQPEAKALP